MTFKIIHLLIVAVYLLCPLVVMAQASMTRDKRRQMHLLRRLRLTAMMGLFAGVLICVLYAAALHGRLLFTQVLLSGYLGTSLLLLLQGCDQLLWAASRWVFRLNRQRGPVWWFNLRAICGLLARAAIVFCIGLPYVLATVLTYRPKVGVTDDPRMMYGWNFDRVQFKATDGVPLVGWWITGVSRGSSRTVVLCPGSDADKATELSLVKRLVPAGYNVLVFDFRARGESGGQLCSFGDLERNDVLGAVRWLRQNHPQACKKVAGLGVGTGAAALVAAAADPSDEGQNIDALAVYDTYDRLDNEVDSLCEQFIPQPLSWCARHFGLPLASCQVGTDLSAFAPMSQIKAIWPRPVLIIHGIDDEFIPFDEGQALYDSALEPKMNFWIQRCGYAGAIKNDQARKMVREYFDEAKRVM